MDLIAVILAFTHAGEVDWAVSDRLEWFLYGFADETTFLFLEWCQRLKTVPSWRGSARSRSRKSHSTLRGKVQ